MIETPAIEFRGFKFTGKGNTGKPVGIEVSLQIATVIAKSCSILNSAFIIQTSFFRLRTSYFRCLNQMK